MKNEPIPVFASPTSRKSRGGLVVAGAIAAGVLALGGAAGVLAAGHPGDTENQASTAASAEAEKSLPASDLFGVTTPAPEATETPEANAPAAGTVIAPASTPRPAVSASHETEHESGQETSDHASSGGDD